MLLLEPEQHIPPEPGADSRHFLTPLPNGAKILTANSSYTKPIEKDCEIETETSRFQIETSDLRDNGSFPNSKRLYQSTMVTAVARRKNQRKSLCYRCNHHIYHHKVSFATFLMFLFKEAIPAFKFHDCSIKGCKCNRFVTGFSPKDLEDELFG